MESVSGWQRLPLRAGGCVVMGLLSWSVEVIMEVVRLFLPD